SVTKDKMLVYLSLYFMYSLCTLEPISEWYCYAHTQTHMDTHTTHHTHTHTHTHTHASDSEGVHVSPRLLQDSSQVCCGMCVILHGGYVVEENTEQMMAG